MKVKIAIIFLFFASINALPLQKNEKIEDSFGKNIQLHVMISAKTQSLEISVINAAMNDGDRIFVSNSEPKNFTKLDLLNSGNYFSNSSEIDSNYFINNHILWKIDSGTILGVYKPRQKHDWIKTELQFNYKESNGVNINTKCYSHWVSYVDENGKILSTGCIRAYPTWMNDMKDEIENFNMKEIFLPGSHDSGSYRPNFNPQKDDTIITKYALTQDDDFRAQLMHGIRYLDIRMGYYRLTKEKFYLVHGITRQRPLREALEQLRDFVAATNEIVIFDVRQFHNSFKDIETHRKLVEFIKSYIGDYLIDARLSWDVKLSDIWQSGKNIILTYGNHDIVQENQDILFQTVNHRWGNKDDWPNLEKYLKSLHGRFAQSAGSDMAELTPNTWGVITDKYGGLRKLADEVNSKVSDLYLNELGATTNILSVDFYRGTTVTELAIHFNKLRKLNAIKRIN